MKKYIAIVTTFVLVVTTPLAVLARDNHSMGSMMGRQTPSPRQEAPRQRMEMPRQQPRQAPVPQRVPETRRAPERSEPRVRPEAPKVYPTPRTHETPKSYPVPRAGDPRGGVDRQPQPAPGAEDGRRRSGDRGHNELPQRPEHHGQPPRHDGHPPRHYGPPPSHFGERHHGHGYGHHEHYGAHHYHYGHSGPSFGDVLGILGAMFIIDTAGNMLFGQTAAEYVVQQCDKYRYYGYDCEIQRTCQRRLFLPPLCKIVVVPVERY